MSRNQKNKISFLNHVLTQLTYNIVSVSQKYLYCANKQNSE